MVHSDKSATLSRDALRSWLDRLGIDQRPPVGLETLDVITKSHLAAFPFENFSVLAGEVPPLELDALTDKLITRRRGGYCFELNSLLLAGLRTLGFDARMRMARVMWNRSIPGPRTHCVVIVNAEGAEYLVDVGFGGPGPNCPLGLDLPVSNTARQGSYRHEDRQGLGKVLCLQTGAERWSDLYCHQDEVTTDGDLEAGNWLAATLPGSLFRTTLVVARQIGDVRRTLNGLALKEVRGGRTARTRNLEDPDAVLACLDEEFGIAPGPTIRQTIQQKLFSN